MSLSEAPLVLGPVFFTRCALVAPRGVAGGVALSGYREQTPQSAFPRISLQTPDLSAPRLLDPAVVGPRPLHPTVGVLALQGDVREHVVALERSGAEVVRVRRPVELAAVDGLVLPGGESTTIDKLVRAFTLPQPLQDAISHRLPVAG